MANEGNLAKLRQTSIANIVNAAGVMAGINEAEARGEVNEANANLARIDAQTRAKMNLAQLADLESQTKTRNILQPGLAAGQEAETNVRIAQAGNLDAQAAQARQQTFDAIANRGLSREILEQNLEKLKRSNEDVVEFQLPDGQSFKGSRDQGIQLLQSLLQAQSVLGRGTGLTLDQQLTRQRQTIEDKQKNFAEAQNLEGVITNPANANKDLSATTERFNSLFPGNHAWIIGKSPGFLGTGVGAGDIPKKVPLPKMSEFGHGEMRWTAADAYLLWRRDKRFSGMSFPDFLKELYRRANEPLPKELQ